MEFKGREEGKKARKREREEERKRGREIENGCSRKE